MKKDKITKDQAIVALKALGLNEKEAKEIIKMRLSALKATLKRQAIDAIINRIEEIEGEKDK